MPDYAILRTAKLTAFGNISASLRHNFRERETPNADPEKRAQNRTSGAQSSQYVLAAIRARLPAKVRKNAVLAIEYFIGASPEWFQKQGKEARDAYFAKAESWLKERHGAANVVAVTRHNDETSPHLCAYVVPIDPNGRLNCSHFLDGRAKLTRMQTDFAERVAEFGLERGIEGSQATHKTVKQYYAEIQTPVRDVRITAASLEPKTIKKGFVFDKVEGQGMVAERLTQAVQEAYRPVIAAAKQYHLGKAAGDARENALAELRAKATLAREIPLESVLERFGCQRDAKDRSNWRTPAGRITVTGTKFYAHDAGKGGGGAIDLAMMLEQTDYRGAVCLLSQEFGTGAVLSQVVAVAKRTVAEIAATPQPYKVPERVEENWPRVRNYLTDVRRIDGKTVDELHETGKIYSDKYANAVFVLGKREGVELRGTGEKPFHGVRGEKRPFILQGEGKNVAFVESAIDALSLRDCGFTGKIVSLSGNAARSAKAMADTYREHGLKIIAAFDKDRAGEQMAVHLGVPRERLVPKHGKDWNDELRARQGETVHERKQDQPGLSR